MRIERLPAVDERESVLRLVTEEPRLAAVPVTAAGTKVAVTSLWLARARAG